MPRTFEQFVSEDKGSLVAQFKEANPDYWAKLQKSPRDIERAKEIILHTNQTIEELKQQHAETRNMRIGEMAIKIFEERTGREPSPETPPGVAPLSNTSILKEARQRVDYIEERELEAIRKNGLDALNITADISQKRKETLEMSDEERTHFKADLHKAVDNGQKARDQARKLFYQERDGLIEQAKAAGSQEPEKDVAIAHREIMDDIKRQVHKDIHAVFEDYGWERGKHAVEFHENVDIERNPEQMNKLVDHVQSVVERNSVNHNESQNKDRSENLENDQDNDQDREYK